MFVTGKPFWPNRMFVVKAGAYSSEAPTMSTNSRQGWKGLSETNTVANLNYDHKKFYNVEPWLVEMEAGNPGVW